jgi:hypothetical protein
MRLMGPDHALGEIAAVPIWDAISKSGGLPEPAAAEGSKRIPVSFMHFAVAKDGVIYVGVERTGYLTAKGYRLYSSTLPRVVKVSAGGRILGVLKGGGSDMAVQGGRDWGRCISELKIAGCGFFNVQGLELDDGGTLYIIDRDGRNGSIAVCERDSEQAKLLEIDTGSYRIRDIIHNPDTGGVVVKVRDNQDRAMYLVELLDGKVVKKDLPRFYMQEWERTRALAQDGEDATLWQVEAQLSEDKQTIDSCKLAMVGSFRLALRAHTRYINYVGRCQRGYVFDVRFETGVEGQRAVFFWNGGPGYAGHLIPPDQGSQIGRVIGHDGEYYEFAVDPRSDVLRIYRAKRIIQLTRDQ